MIRLAAWKQVMWRLSLWLGIVLVCGVAQAQPGTAAGGWTIWERIFTYQFSEKGWMKEDLSALDNEENWTVGEWTARSAAISRDGCINAVHDYHKDKERIANMEASDFFAVHLIDSNQEGAIDFKQEGLGLKTRIALLGKKRMEIVYLACWPAPIKPD